MRSLDAADEGYVTMASFVSAIVPGRAAPKKSHATGGSESLWSRVR